MGEYIERGETIGAIVTAATRFCRDVELVANIIHAVETIPAADVRPVVLCRDCRNNRHCMIQDFMEDYGITPNDQNNFFCGYGEREES